MEVEIKFEPSGRNGIVAVGSYLSDAARRLGIEIVDEFEGLGEYEADVVEIKKGRELLSEPTKIEINHLNSARRSRGERLAGQTRIEKSGEIIVMVAKKKEAEKPEEEEKIEDFKKEFAEMPLEKKVANLLEMEAVTLSETISFVVNSPFAIFDKIIDVMAEFGLKLETDAKKAKRPTEHKAEEKVKKTTAAVSKTKTVAKAKAGTTKSAAKKSTAAKSVKRTTAQPKAARPQADATEKKENNTENTGQTDNK